MSSSTTLDASDSGTAPGVVAEPATTQLPDEVLAFLVRATPTRAVWKWLNEDENAGLLHDLTRGFQRTANTLRQPVVRSRLIHHLQNENKTFETLLKLWGGSTPSPAVVPEIRELQDDAQLVEHLPQLWQRHGAESLLLALLLDERQAALDALDGVAGQMSGPEEQSTETGDDGAVTPEEETAPADSPPESSLREELARAQTELATWRGRATKAEAELAQTREALSAARLQLQNEMRALQRQIKQEDRRAETAETSLQETRRLLDRTTRRGKSTEREVAELSTENKRMKRQLRNQQEISEDLRKQLAHLSAKLEGVRQELAALQPPPDQSGTTAQPETATAPAKVRSSKPKAPAVSPLDQPFIWKSDGRPFRVTPRDVKRAIDRNDEDHVFSLIQAFDALREINEPGYRLFLDRLREFGRYYPRVLTTDTTRLLVDASNVTRFEPDRYGKGQLRHLLAMRDELRRRDCFPIIIYADASLPYKIDEPDELQQMVKRGEVHLTRSGQEADEVLAREARRTGAYVVTNDRGFHLKVSPDFEPLRITFRIYNGVLVVDEF